MVVAKDFYLIEVIDQGFSNAPWTSPTKTEFSDRMKRRTGYENIVAFFEVRHLAARRMLSGLLCIISQFCIDKRMQIGTELDQFFDVEFGIKLCLSDCDRPSCSCAYERTYWTSRLMSLKCCDWTDIFTLWGRRVVEHRLDNGNEARAVLVVRL